MFSFNLSEHVSLRTVWASYSNSYNLANLNSSIPELLQCWSDICLELVLHTCQTQKLHLPLQALYHCCNFQGSVMDTQFCLVVAVLNQPPAEEKIRILKGVKIWRLKCKICVEKRRKHGIQCTVNIHLKILILLLWQRLLCYHQCPQTFSCHVSTLGQRRKKRFE